MDLCAIASLIEIPPGYEGERDCEGGKSSTDPSRDSAIALSEKFALEIPSRKRDLLHFGLKEEGNS